MNCTFFIPYETPSKKNSRVIDRRTGRSFPSTTYREWHRKAVLWLKTNYDLPTLGQGPFCLYMGFTHGDKRRRDSDNGVSSVLDLLVDLKVLPDDNWDVVRKISVENRYEKDHPGCEVAIVPVINVD